MNYRDLTERVIDKWKRRLGSDAAIARALCVSSSTVSRWRRGAMPDAVYELMSASVGHGGDFDDVVFLLVWKNGSEKDVEHYRDYTGGGLGRRK